MPRGDKSSYTDKQKRKAEHIEEGYEDRGVSHEEAERRAWATVNKETGGGKKSGPCGSASLDGRKRCAAICRAFAAHVSAKFAMRMLISTALGRAQITNAGATV